MLPRKPLVAALAVVIVVLGTAVSIGAGVSTNDRMYVTFNQPVSLPGVSLGSGTYIFERLDMSSHGVVQVLSRDRKVSHYLGFTAPVPRPAGLKHDQVISFAEAAPDAPQPISIWWPENSTGRQFIYPKK
jgi:hypothetical protein